MLSANWYEINWLALESGRDFWLSNALTKSEVQNDQAKRTLSQFHAFSTVLYEKVTCGTTSCGLPWMGLVWFTPKLASTSTGQKSSVMPDATSRRCTQRQSSERLQKSSWKNACQSKRENISFYWATNSNQFCLNLCWKHRKDLQHHTIPTRCHSSWFPEPEIHSIRLLPWMVREMFSTKREFEARLCARSFLITLVATAQIQVQMWL